ncbi:MAG: roadblock/LC7 domain-containing protein [Anaerolineales bacterium]|nr:roadblock/LC7 domain-containing protein [Anaerolineales bacterium]MCK5635143.1 roadblock/LC7 domain-containing protein [Anaerolineales bacterium]
MVTRQSELIRVLEMIAEELPDPLWVALVDDDGLLVACVPSQPPVDVDQISAMTAALALTALRVLVEIDAEEFRYSSVAGSERQLLLVALDGKRFLSIGLKPDVVVQAVFRPLSRRVAELLKILRMRFSVS